MECNNWPIGVCSWSLQTDIAGVAEAMEKIGLEHVQIAIRPAVENKEVLNQIEKQVWTITSTMLDFPHEDYSTLNTIKATGGIVPDDCWQYNQKLFTKALHLTAELGVDYISMHAGFIDESNEEHRIKFTDRIKSFADAADAKEIKLLLETGQETAEALRNFLEELDHPALAVNFDPANMILYDKGNPIDAVHILGPWIEHIHIKDAIRTKEPGTWGQEVPWGDGQVRPVAFLTALEDIGYDGALAIEREAGNSRFEDIRHAAELLSSIT